MIMVSNLVVEFQTVSQAQEEAVETQSLTAQVPLTLVQVQGVDLMRGQCSVRPDERSHKWILLPEETQRKVTVNSTNGHTQANLQDEIQSPTTHILASDSSQSEAHDSREIAESNAFIRLSHRSRQVIVQILQVLVVAQVKRSRGRRTSTVHIAYGR